MKAMYNGQLLFGPRGPAGPDGNPIGTIISYMGLTAPEDYLICDGSSYNIADYPSLAKFFKEQFGTENHFGGDGETTFAVPDMRNLFLRGYHGEAEEQLSGEIGVKQEATKQANVYTSADMLFAGVVPSGSTNVSASGTADTLHTTETFMRVAKLSMGDYSIPGLYTARPVNMAVLYCIKAIESVSYENIYSTKETRIGTWFDKPLYRKTFQYTTPKSIGVSLVNIGFDKNGEVKNVYGYIILKTNGSSIPINFKTYPDQYFSAAIQLPECELYVALTEAYTDCPGFITIEYTKATD